MSYKTDYKAVAGLGSAKDGTASFHLAAADRDCADPSGAGLRLLSFMPGAGRGACRRCWQPMPIRFTRWWPSAFSSSRFRHLRLGLQVVIEDYVHTERTRLICLILNALTWRGVAVAGAFAVAKIALGA